MTFAHESRERKNCKTIKCNPSTSKISLRQSNGRFRSICRLKIPSTLHTAMTACFNQHPFFFIFPIHSSSLPYSFIQYLPFIHPVFPTILSSLPYSRIQSFLFIYPVFPTHSSSLSIHSSSLPY